MYELALGPKAAIIDINVSQLEKQKTYSMNNMAGKASRDGTNKL